MGQRPRLGPFGMTGLRTGKNDDELWDKFKKMSNK